MCVWIRLMVQSAAGGEKAEELWEGECVSSVLRCTAHSEHVHFSSLSVLVYACQMDNLSTRGWVCMCQSVQVLGTAVGDVTPMRSPTLQTLHAPIAFPAHASSHGSFITPFLPPASSHPSLCFRVCPPPFS